MTHCLNICITSSCIVTCELTRQLGNWIDDPRLTLVSLAEASLKVLRNIIGGKREGVEENEGKISHYKAYGVFY